MGDQAGSQERGPSLGRSKAARVYRVLVNVHDLLDKTEAAVWAVLRREGRLWQRCT
jgi:hypothetical protein